MFSIRIDDEIQTAEIGQEKTITPGLGSDTSKWSLILISLPKGYVSDRIGHY